MTGAGPWQRGGRHGGRRGEGRRNEVADSRFGFDQHAVGRVPITGRAGRPAADRVARGDPRRGRRHLPADRPGLWVGHRLHTARGGGRPGPVGHRAGVGLRRAGRGLRVRPRLRSARQPLGHDRAGRDAQVPLGRGAVLPRRPVRGRDPRRAGPAGGVRRRRQGRSAAARSDGAGRGLRHPRRVPGRGADHVHSADRRDGHRHRRARGVACRRPGRGPHGRRDDPGHGARVRRVAQPGAVDRPDAGLRRVPFMGRLHRGTHRRSDPRRVAL